MECTYCGEDLPETAGKLFVQADGSRYAFCSGKCQQNWEKNRKLEYAEQ